MKKIITFLLLILTIPVFVLAKPAYTSLTLKETLDDERIESNLDGYEEGNNKATIYLFRGRGCSHCHEFLEYVNSTLVEKYGDYFKLVSYEVWNNANNAKLMQEVSDYRKDNANGVPYIIIGDKSFNGYAESMNEEIETAIMDLYNSKERYDIFEKMKINPKAKVKKNNKTTKVIIAATAIAIIVLVITIPKKAK